MRIDIEVVDQRVRRALRRVGRAASDLTPAMRAVAGHLVASAHTSFERESSPDGTPWAPLSPVTVKRRGSAHPILRVDGDLLRSIIGDWGRDFAEAGTGDVRATPLHFGAQRGAFGVTSRGGPIPWGDIPARPFLGLWPEHADAIRRDIVDYIAEPWGDA